MSEAARRFGPVEMVLSGSVVLGVLLWQLWSIRRDQRRFGDRNRNRDGEDRR